MTDAAKNNIKATFEANPSLKELYANEYGHCFKSPGEGLSLVTRESIEGKGGSSDEVANVETMTVAQLKEALTALNVEFDAKANKATLVELLKAEQAK